jgi:2-oxoglutarate/2-oxoacid ferredoxin oxidoreductase subunit beta
LIFRKNRNRGIRISEMSRPEIVELGGEIKEDDLLFHDEKAHEPSLAFLLARMRHPEFPEPMGVFRDVQRPTYDEGVVNQVEAARAKLGSGDLDALYNDGDTWVVQ